MVLGGKAAFPSKVVIDTNVLISAIITDGTCRQLIRLLTLRRKEIVVSDFILGEVKKFLAGKEFSHRKKVPEIVASLKGLVIVVRLSKKRGRKPRQLRDPKDQPIIQTARQAKVKIIITGDEDLLVLDKVGSVKIISVKEAIKLLL